MKGINKRKITKFYEEHLLSYHNEYVAIGAKVNNILSGKNTSNICHINNLRYGTDASIEFDSQ